MKWKECKTPILQILAMSAMIYAPGALCADGPVPWNHNCDCVSGDCGGVTRYTAKCNNVVDTFCINKDELPRINSDASQFCGGARGGLQVLVDQNGNHFRYDPEHPSMPTSCLPRDALPSDVSDCCSHQLYQAGRGIVRCL